MSLTLLPKGIFKRGSNYAVRFTGPAELRQALGKREIIRFLGTSDLGAAPSRRRETLDEIKASRFAKCDEPVDEPGSQLVFGTTLREGLQDAAADNLAVHLRIAA
ncbi:hypothetical protein BV509_18160 [Rhodovulum sulfidophilum]|uniref:DUF6538 domain-containing protein n=1 Tax=Rhodovulum visakhapatnamense TaxID=364297 RepID=A0ABS1RKR8_9RHOB|nr:DUF6538 domain-containing protein [Rhodovulum visakhapatnamense]MBL3571247.1 hypothetical protein [Rhodovulum visakhapatnamense]MBL3580228.1 hypothetical protein [Rhodovulum visakhapatnamense]OLS46084.1 hypothetical protein BV509_18160 [Rhodovulum sulfidophilum]